ncbi:glycosyltransferase family 39 protein [Candidatus Enterococcus mansonii]|uniref:Glycosyltransferase RgtA/B/C/D-like domain-containing protein n=1 Tax=Candidatus Enterococcus mansonii TaxID=1834181 RepID=A0A242CIR7_9ENTE|nr:glycosyltransferase family 39 protein [Enterococcus sp. 4G2_DIV0659]OTO10018.1 hypothetical protein A5880_000701 [Enterococcus sp. 4G2_DIV0659]
MKKTMFSLLNYAFLLSILLTFYGSLRSSLLDISNINNKIWGGLLIFLCIISVILFSKSIRLYVKNICYKLFDFSKKHLSIITRISFVFIFMLQIIILYFIHVPIGWDVDAIHSSVTELIKHSPNSIASIYLSKNPNNSLFFFLMYFISQLGNFIHHSLGYSWLFWQLVNTIFMDIGFIFIFLAAKNLFNTKIAYISFYLALISLALSPWILVVYTDTIILPIISVIFWVYSLVKNKSNKIFSIILGILIAISYLLKPSSIVFLVAYAIVESIILITTHKKKHLKKAIVVSLLFFLSFTGTVTLFHTFEEHQSLIVLDKDKAKPWQHFIMMGLNGNGGFSETDTAAIISLPTQKEKIDYANSKIKERLKRYGFTGYTKFLFKKHIYNTDRGDFGWGIDGTAQVSEDSKNPIKNLLRDTYYQQGERVKTIRFFMHILWLITLIGLLFVTQKNFQDDDQDITLAVFKLSILGAFLYLLLFEGGRSRYLIQYLPIIYMLSANGFYFRFFTTDTNTLSNHK